LCPALKNGRSGGQDLANVFMDFRITANMRFFLLFNINPPCLLYLDM